MNSGFRFERVPTTTFRIWIAGECEAAKTACREFVMRGLCVAVQRAEYIYTMGAENGVCVTVINYPRFPKTEREVESLATDLGFLLCERLFQGSFTVEGPVYTKWYSRRAQDVGG